MGQQQQQMQQQQQIQQQQQQMQQQQHEQQGHLPSSACADMYGSSIGVANGRSLHAEAVDTTGMWMWASHSSTQGVSGYPHAPCDAYDSYTAHMHSQRTVPLYNNQGHSAQSQDGDHHMPSQHQHHDHSAYTGGRPGDTF